MMVIVSNCNPSFTLFWCQESPEDTVTESESSFDFDLPDESQYLESSIRLTRNDMRSPDAAAESDDTKHGSDDSDTDHVLSRDDIMPNSTRKSL